MSKTERMPTEVRLPDPAMRQPRIVGVYRCQKAWDQLQPTTLPEVKFCDACSRSVFRVHDAEGFLQAVAADRCIAVADDEVMVGRPVAISNHQPGQPLDWDDQ